MSSKFVYRHRDLLIIMCYMLVACGLLLALDTNYLAGSLIYFFVPALYLSVRHARMVVPVVLFSAVFSVGCGVIVDYFGSLDASWNVHSMFGLRLFDVAALEDFIMVGLLTYLTVMLASAYRPILSDEDRLKWQKPVSAGGTSSVQARYPDLSLYVAASVSWLLTIFAHTVWPGATVPYAFLWVNLALLGLPVVVSWVRFPAVRRNLITSGVIGFIFGVAFETVALHSSYWDFQPGHFVASVHLFGRMIPLEEFGIWLLYCPAVMAFYTYPVLRDRKT
jgi:hypothetical protein